MDTIQKIKTAEDTAKKILASAKNIADLVNNRKLSGRMYVDRINVRNEEYPEVVWVIVIKDIETPDSINEAAKLFTIDSKEGFIWAQSLSKYNYERVTKNKLMHLHQNDLDFLLEAFSSLEKELSY